MDITKLSTNQSATVILDPMVSADDQAAIVAMVGKSGAKLVTIGDPAQK